MRIDRPEHYFRAGVERMRQATLLYRDEEGESYALSMYIAGLAVECMLRAFKIRRDPTFDERHDLSRLFKASGMLDVDPDVLKANGLSEGDARRYFLELQSAVTAVHTLWGNDFRFASEERMRSHLRTSNLNRGIKGDALKENARKLLSVAQKVHDLGVLQWHSRKKSNPS